MNKRKKIVVLVSGSGSNLQAIINNCDNGQINGDVVAVVSNVPGVYALTRAQNTQIDTHVIDHTLYKTRLEFDQALYACVNEYGPDLLVLAGFMRILSADFVQHFVGRMLNIHPSLLPKYPGLHTHKKVIANKDQQHGASIHFVTAELDGGPIVLQSCIQVKCDDNEQTIQRKVGLTEWLIYPLAIQWFCKDALRLVKDQVWLCKENVNDERFSFDYTFQLSTSKSNDGDLVIIDADKADDNLDLQVLSCELRLQNKDSDGVKAIVKKQKGAKEGATIDEENNK